MTRDSVTGMAAYEKRITNWTLPKESTLGYRFE
jgi:hypothetical protein